MTDTDKLTVARLLTAIDQCRTPQTFTLSLPPKFGELDARLAATEATSQARNANLDRAMATARALIV